MNTPSRCRIPRSSPGQRTRAGVFRTGAGLALTAAVLLAAAPAAAQQAHLTPDEYGQWQSVGAASLSPDGTWFAYQISPVEGDGWLMVHREGEAPGEGIRFDHASQASFSDDGRHLAFRIGLPEDEERELHEREERVKYDVGILDLESGRADTVAAVESFSFAPGGRYLALGKYPPEQAETRGRDIVLRDLETGESQLIGNVSEYAFDEDGDRLAYLTDSYDRLGNGAYVRTLETAATRTLDTERERYRDLVWHEDGTALAFLRSGELPNHEEETYEVVAARGVDGDSPDTRTLRPGERADIPAGYRVVEHRNLRWSDDGERLFMGVQEATPAEDPEEGDGSEGTEVEEEDDPDAHLDPTNVEVWHWRDDPTQPRQQATEQQVLQENLLSVWHVDEDRFLKLTDDFDHSLTLTGDQHHAVLSDPGPHRPRLRESWNDIYVVDVETGERTLVVERQESVQSSPGGDYLLYFRQGDWHAYDIAEGEHHNLTGDLEPDFRNYTRITGREFHPPWGAGQWAEDDAWVLLYDRYDVHQVSPDGESAHRLTDGRAEEIRYRQHRFDFDADPLGPDEPIYFSMYGERTKDRGYARGVPGGEAEALIYEAAQIGRLTKADEAELYAYQRQTATESPDFHRTDEAFANPTALTRTNPQQEDYHWADDELVRFTSARGEELEGRLLYPADYDPDRQYPMIVYIYELMSPQLHAYTLPNRTNAYNARRFSSEGYFVFMPDITYEERRPGESAVESVVPAVEEVLGTGMIDEDRIGLTGHSWGGYQTNFIVSQTDLFSSAVAGAPLTNMVSMYNQFYWSTGNTNQSIFETGQGRLPDPWWEDWQSFHDNSPIHQMDPEMDTPLLLMFGTEDGAVDFSQGVELYVAMRRMENPFVMLVYEGEGHSLGRRENQLDYAERAFEWHHHHLMGEEAPDWIEEGKPHTDRPVMQEQQGSPGR